MSITPIDTDTRFLRQTISDLTEERDLLNLMQDMSRQIISGFDFTQIIDLFLETVREITDYRACALYLMEKGTQDQRPVVTRGENVEHLLELKPDDAIIAWVLNENRWTHTMGDESLPGAHPYVGILPLRGAKATLGYLLMETPAEKKIINPANMKLLSFVADQTGIALENQGLYAELNQSRQYIANILESIQNGIVSIDMANRITQFNKNATALLGLPTADIQGRRYPEVLPSELVILVDRLKKTVFERGFAQEQLFEFSPTAYLKIPLEITSTQLLDEKGVRIGFTVVIRDMSASKEIERLRQLDVLKNEFVSNVSHEFRTPLSIIKSHVEAVLDQVDTHDQETRQAFLTIIDEEVDRMTVLVDDLLDISRIESGRFEMEMTAVRLEEIITQVLRKLGDTGPLHRIITRVPPDLPDLTADPDKLVQVLLNLLNNALKFSPQGGDIEIRAAFDGKMLCCQVMDNGIGIAKKDLPHIFDKFYRVDNSDTHEIQGTGLGLSIVKYIIESHGGHIEVKSQPGRGTVFSIYLPLGPAHGK